MRHAKKKESMTYVPRKKAGNRNCESYQMSYLTDFKEAIRNMFKEQKEIMIKGVKYDDNVTSNRKYQ